MDADWDLNAVVRSFDMHGRFADNYNVPPPIPPFFQQHQEEEEEEEDPFWGLVNFGKPKNGVCFDELGKIFVSSSQIGNPSYHSMSNFSNPNSQICHQLPLDQHQFRDQTPVACPAADANPGPRSRKRKNQAKVVIRVPSESLPGDNIWAWRKYGQKPIKGSPYPRSYYRCSSTTDCVAKKQVEQHPSGEDLYIITYTGVHSHPRPTHRNSLAGSTRVKHSSTAASASAAIDKQLNDIINPSLIDLSPTTPLMAPPTVVKEVNGEDDDGDDDVEEMEGEDDDGLDDEDILIPNIAMNEDIFMGFKELGREIPNSSTAQFRRRPPRFPPPAPGKSPENRI